MDLARGKGELGLLRKKLLSFFISFSFATEQVRGIDNRLLVRVVIFLSCTRESYLLSTSWFHRSTSNAKVIIYFYQLLLLLPWIIKGRFEKFKKGVNSSRVSFPRPFKHKDDIVAAPFCFIRSDCTNDGIKIKSSCWNQASFPLRPDNFYCSYPDQDIAGLDSALTFGKAAFSNTALMVGADSAPETRWIGESSQSK